MSTDIILNKLIKAVSFKFKEDLTAPGVTVSFLKNGEYYCSVVRYHEAFAKGKEVVCSGHGLSLHDAVLNAAQSFLKIVVPTPDPITDLGATIRSC